AVLGPHLHLAAAKLAALAPPQPMMVLAPSLSVPPQQHHQQSVRKQVADACTLVSVSRGSTRAQQNAPSIVVATPVLNVPPKAHLVRPLSVEAVRAITPQCALAQRLVHIVFCQQPQLISHGL